HETLVVGGSPELAALLASSSDALIVDLSDGLPADWSTLQAAVSRCVFVSAWGQHEAAEAAFASLGVAGPMLCLSPGWEMQRRGQFRAAVLNAMRAAHPA